MSTAVCLRSATCANGNVKPGTRAHDLETLRRARLFGCFSGCLLGGESSRHVSFEGLIRSSSGSCNWQEPLHVHAHVSACWGGSESQSGNQRRRLEQIQAGPSYLGRGGDPMLCSNTFSAASFGCAGFCARFCARFCVCLFLHVFMHRCLWIQPEEAETLFVYYIVLIHTYDLLYGATHGCTPTHVLFTCPS